MATYSVSSNGRTVVSQGGNQTGVFYIIDSGSLLFMPLGGANGTSDPTVQWLER